ncbi:hypothetical protein MBLNU459_g2010t1 [Dothideomycetes sp. NU459]
MSARNRSAAVGENDVKVTTVFSHEHALLNEDATLDEKTLGALGYRQEFKRDFSIWESFSVSFSVLGILPSIASTISYGLGYSGTGGLVWGWLIASLFIQATAFSMAELCSSMPTAGGLYYASAAMAPEGWGPICSWFVGWSNICGFVTGPCSINYALASMLVACGEIAYPAYTAHTWQVYLCFLLLPIAEGALAMQSTQFIGWANKVGTVWNVLIVIIFVIWFPAGSINSPKTNTSHNVWTQFENGTEWPIGWATVMGFLTAVWTMSGYDAPFHLSEECSNANLASPRAIVMTAQIGMYMGWAVVLVIAYTVKDVSSVLSGGQSFGNLCLQVLGVKAGLAMFALNIVGQFFVGLGGTIICARVIFAYSRDGALPGSRFWRKVDRRTKTSVLATWGILTVSALLGLLMFAGPTAIGAVFSIGAIAQYTSFTFPIAPKLFFDRGRFKPVLVPALCFPAVKGAALDALTMNWTCLIYGGAMLFAMLRYLVSGRKWFKGPRVNVGFVDEVHETLAAQSGSESVQNEKAN